ncbi:cytochrome b5-related protein [Tribolium castaneum]|uniref:Cytochrome b5-related protein n=1 Tax=Tribolium castaneum TaxID=7070 RepID=D6WVJ2_TRICA|nr:PREDICTED: cytochrome b5-related protein [Tribolium castaneum]XP_015837790.1 PREDICTED: cytochrome b5-related protein [Tribolium castaneum]XP_975884.1 PREDICTED: cytochrome b5-related protein [Tribolium castaneum]EFA08577.1 Cytochrome b5-related protein-like Protein [Tribolium castaneum]|eukprot:XP_008196501.1 PREDICTED: cytochrome b5-related protein [Tribolium castaneum]
MTVTISRFSSSLGIKYPTLRDDPLKNGLQWLKGKRADDGAEGLWRVHDNLYDLSDFVNLHPGGAEWLQLTKGTDITEAFETHHLTTTAEKLVEKYFIRKAKTPRNSPFTFKEGDFYKTLKRNIVEKLKYVPNEPAQRSKRITDFLLFAYVSLALLAAVFRSFTFGMFSGIFLSLTAIAAHNFFHQRDNFRMYYFNFTLMEYSEWRISHALSHHLHTNTINDLEISSLEPFLEYLPGKKHILVQLAQIFISPIVWCFIFLGSFIRSLISTILGEKPFEMVIFLPFSVLAAMVVLSGEIIFPLVMFSCIQLTGSLHFGAVGLNAAHHHPEIFHDGDTPRKEKDWGIYQMDAVMDRKDITGSHFLVLTNFGDHALHHLFPTIDHGLLDYLYPTFLKTCADFGIEWRLSSQIELVKGQIRQLVKIKPNEEPPRSLKPIKFL